VIFIGLFWHADAVAQRLKWAYSLSGPTFVKVLGAVRRPGPVSGSREAATVDQVLALAGGARDDAYRFASLLLRPVADVAPRFPCVSPGARHAALLMGDDPELRREGELIRGLLDGRVQRMPAHNTPFGRLGKDRGVPLAVAVNDVLALPQRTSRIFVMLNNGRVETVEHKPDATADAYLAALPREQRAPLRDYVMHYPDGSVAALNLEGWNATPVTVPPGSMLAPDAGCLPVLE
jgi:hypothetical protein